MNLTTRLAKLEKHQPQIDQEQRQKMIASIEQWLVELEEKGPDGFGHPPLSRGHTRDACRKAMRSKGANLQEPGSPQGCSLQAAKVDVACQ
jgi:hypothetical protein